MQSKTIYLTDPHDFCRRCRGNGGWWERLDRIDRWVPCWLCGGSGQRSVRVEVRE